MLRFIAVEDLDGVKVTAQYNFDPRTLSNDSTAFTASADGTPTKNTLTGLARDEIFVGISGGFGNVRLGSPNSIGLGSHGTSSPLGTGIGSAYTGAGTPGTLTNSYVQTRYNRSVRYDSPAIAGLTASVLFAPGGDNADIGTTALVIPNARKATEFGLSYANGPLNVAYAYVAQAAQTYKTGWYAGTYANIASPADNPAKTSVSMINANYKLGDTTLYAGWNKGNRLAVFSSTDGSAVDTKGFRVAAKQTMGAIDLIAQYTEQTAASGASGADVKAKVTGLRADYNLSKTAAAYVGYEKWDTGMDYTAGATTSLVTGTRTITSVGLRKSF